MALNGPANVFDEERLKAFGAFKILSKLRFVNALLV